MTQINSLKHKAHLINTEIYALYLSYRDNSVKWYVRVILAVAIGYGLSPIDLIPDFIAVFGFLDDIIIMAAGLSISYQLLTKKVIDRARVQAFEELNSDSNTATVAYRVVGYAWMLAISLAAAFLYKMLYVNLL